MKPIQMGSSKIKPLTARQRALALAERFRKIYPDAHCELDFGNPLQLLIATILSAQCTDKRVNMVTPALFKKYSDARAFAKARPATFESEIRTTGFFRSKTKSILGACQAIVSKRAGKVPDAMEELCELPGVGRKTANVVLGNAFGKNEGIVVDTHVIRLSQRFKLTKNRDAEKIERDLMKIVPQRDWTLWSHWLIWHGRRRCFARKPDCANCEVSRFARAEGFFCAKVKQRRRSSYVFCWATRSRSSQLGVLARLSHQLRHCRATAPGCLIRKGRRERRPYKILKTAALLE